MFYLSLTQTLTSNVEPVGFVSSRVNSVQRRMGDRVLWDRLVNDTPIFPGDLIRVADLSGALINFDENYIELEENTLIRISVSDGRAQIELGSGTLNLSSAAESGTINLFIGGRTIEAGGGTVLSASSADEGAVLRVLQGPAALIDNGISREIEAGTVISEDAYGNEVFLPSVIVSRPRPNAHLLARAAEPLNVVFAWNAVNTGGENLRMEIASDRNFTRNEAVIYALDTAQIALGAGFWHWRLLYRDQVLHNGRITITETATPALIAPAAGSLFAYEYNPQLRFLWSGVEEASHYILEASQTADFSVVALQTAVWGTSIVSNDLGHGTWYWRVSSVFPPNFEGEGSVSSVASFRISPSEPEPEPPVIIAEPEPEPEPEPPPPAPPPPPLPPPLLAAPANMQPAAGFRLGAAELRARDSINFSWLPVSEANAYILSLFHQTAGGRRLLMQTAPFANTNWTLLDFSILEIGTIVWQVEAINRNPNGVIVRRGTTGESSFVIDIPIPQVTLPGDIGTLYGVE